MISVTLYLISECIAILLGQLFQYDVLLHISLSLKIAAPSWIILIFHYLFNFHKVNKLLQTTDPASVSEEEFYLYSVTETLLPPLTSCCFSLPLKERNTNLILDWLQSRHQFKSHHFVKQLGLDQRLLITCEKHKQKKHIKQTFGFLSCFSVSCSSLKCYFLHRVALKGGVAFLFHCVLRGLKQQIYIFYKTLNKTRKEVTRDENNPISYAFKIDHVIYEIKYN